jgi:hypothetical protein
MRREVLLLALALTMGTAGQVSARECTYRELADKVGEKMTISAKIDAVEPEEDDPKSVWITLDNSGADHCLTFLTGIPKPQLGNCKAGKQITATGKVLERMDAWWGLEKVTGITCK